MFDDEARGLRIVGASQKVPTGKRQQRFARLVKDVARYKDAIRVWTQAGPEIDRAVAECRRLEGEHREALAEVVRVLDRGSSDRALTKRERRFLSEMLCDTAHEILQAGGPEDVKEIYNRHSQGDFDAEAAFEEQMQTAAMKSMLEGFGFDFEGATIRSLGDLQEATVAQAQEMQREAEEREQAARERAARRKKPARQVAAEARREAERAKVGKALQDVYRKLAVVLHPDREPDPEEQARKTVLMAQVNVAYQQKDLLQLLELQLRFEQIDEAKISSLAEDQLERYNRLFAEQVSQLRSELAEIEMSWRAQLELPAGKVTPARVRTALERDRRAMVEELRDVRGRAKELADPRALKQFLRNIMSIERDLEAHGFGDLLRG